MISYFDNASTTYQKPKCVYSAVKLFKRVGANVSRGTRDDRSKEIMRSTRQNIKKLVGANELYEVAFSQSATYSINQILRGLDYGNIHNIFISQFEHNSVLRTLLDLKKIYGFNLHYLQYNNFELRADLIKKQFQKETPDLVIISHISNVCGKVQNYEEVFCMAHQYKAITILDMAQSCGLIEINMLRDNVDIAIFAGHKTLYGFTGIGGAVIKRTIPIQPLITGGIGVDSANKDMPKYLPEKLEPGTQNILGIMSLYLSTRYLIKKGYKKIESIEKKNYDKLKNILRLSKVLKIVETGTKSRSIISCYSNMYSPDNFEKFFTKRNVCIRTGLQCSPISHKKIGTYPEGTIRFSIGLYTKNREFRTLKKVILVMNKHFSQKSDL